jgi:hypothetical protein
MVRAEHGEPESMLDNVYLRREPTNDVVTRSHTFGSVLPYDVVGYRDPLCIEEGIRWPWYQRDLPRKGVPRRGGTRIEIRGIVYRAIWYPDAPPAAPSPVAPSPQCDRGLYVAQRQQHIALYALALARKDFAAGKKSFMHEPKFYPWHGHAFGNGFHGDDKRCFVENPTEAGLRLVGYAGELVDLPDRHTGWYTREDPTDDDILKGVVYQLPARNGRVQFVYGYEEGWNAPGALLCFGNVIEGGRYQDADHMRESDALRKACRAADKMAEHDAEQEVEYNRAWQAGVEAAEKEQEAVTIRKETLALIREVKAKMRQLCDAPSLVKTLRRDIESAWEQIQELRRERDSLRDEWEWMNKEAFADGYANA